MRKRWILVFLVLVMAAALLPQWDVLSARMLQIADSTPVFLPMLGNGQQAPTPTPPAPTPTPPGPTPTTPPIVYPQGMIVVDHTNIALFDRIPTQFLEAARGLPMMFSDRSVGSNISDGLSCLAAPSWVDSLSSCRRDYIGDTDEWKTYTETDLLVGDVPDRIYFDADLVSQTLTKYDRRNWFFEYRAGSWQELTQDFITSLAPQHINSKSVLSYQFSYLNVADGDDIADPQVGFFANNSDRWDVYDLEAYIAQHPDKVFIFWTTSLARVSTGVADDFNNQMRQYALARYQSGQPTVLFDVADILSHTPEGVPCFDAQGHANICRDYTTEDIGGHLGSVSAGKIQVAKGFWVLMAQIAGWQP
jgi:hypothetical protein